MYPYITLGQFTIAVYGLCIVIGLGAGFLTANIRCTAFAIGKQDAFFSLLYASIGLAAGGKILYILVSLRYIASILPVYGFEPVLRGGFIFYGGVGGSTLAVCIYAKQYKLSCAPLISLLFLVTPLVHAFGRMGCFFAGCCYGIPWEGPGSIFLHGENRLPVQLIEASLNMIVFAILLGLSFSKKNTKFIPQIYLVFYSCIRFILEFFRADAERGSFGPFSTSQWISLVIITAVPAYQIYNKITRR